VARGFTQIEGVDYFDTFTPVAKATTVRLFFVIANNFRMRIHQADIRAAYLNGNMEEELYKRQPIGFEVSNPNGGVLYCRLKKALYGTKQAGRAWRKVLLEYLLKYGFKMHSHDKCLFTLNNLEDESFLMIVVWVDDIITAYRDEDTKGVLQLHFIEI
jgi:hypothetical protein